MEFEAAVYCWRCHCVVEFLSSVLLYHDECGIFGLFVDMVSDGLYIHDHACMKRL
jgi:hypothetical protein